MKRERKKQFKIYILIGVLIVLFLCMKLLLSGSTAKRYDSLESAFKYHYGDDSEVMLILDGKKSSYIVGDDGSIHTAITFSKGNNYWKDITLPNMLWFKTKPLLHFLSYSCRVGNLISNYQLIWLLDFAF